MQISFFLIALQIAAVRSFYLPNNNILTSSAIGRTRRNAGPSDFLSGLFKDSKKVTAERSAKAALLKKNLVDITKGTSNGMKANAEVRSEVAEIVNNLEKLNDVKTISSSPVMNGNWKLLYTTNSGSSAGKLGPFIGRVDQDINVSGSKYINYVRLGGIVQGALSATWDNLSPKLWKVKFIDIEISIFGIPIQKKSLLGSEGTWRMTYLDDSIRILYALGGKNSLTENIYILARDKF